MTTITALGESKHGTHNQKIDSFLRNNKFKAIFLELPNDFQLHVEFYKKSGYFSDGLESFITGAQKEENSIREEFELLFNYSKNERVPVDSLAQKQMRVYLLRRLDFSLLCSCSFILAK